MSYWNPFSSKKTRALDRRDSAEIRSSLRIQRLRYDILKNVPSAINKSFYYFLNKSIDGSIWNCNLQVTMLLIFKTRHVGINFFMTRKLYDLLIDVKYVIWLWNTKFKSLKRFIFFIKKYVCRRCLLRKIKIFNFRNTYSLMKINFIDLNILFYNVYLSVPSNGSMRFHVKKKGNKIVFEKQSLIYARLLDVVVIIMTVVGNHSRRLHIANTFFNPLDTNDGRHGFSFRHINLVLYL